MSACAGRTEGTATRRAEEALFAAPPTSDRMAMTPDPDVVAGAGAAREMLACHECKPPSAPVPESRPASLSPYRGPYATPI